MSQSIVALTVGTIIVALILQAVLFYWISKNQIRTQNMSDRETSLSNMESELTSTIQSINKTMLALYQTDNLIYYINNQDDKASKEKLYFWANNVKGKFDSSLGLKAIYVYDNDNQILSTYRANVRDYVIDIYSDSTGTNAKKVLEYAQSDRTTTLISGYYNRSEGTYIIRFVSKIRVSNQNGTTQYGYIVCDFSTTAFTTIMNKYVWGEDITIWIQPEGDLALAQVGEQTSEESVILQGIRKLVKKSLSTETFLAQYPNYDLITLERSDSYNLNIYELVPQSLMVATQQNVFFSFLLISAIIGLLGAIFTGAVSRALFAPVEEMKDTIVRIREGETDLRVLPVDWSEELEVLGKEFNKMLNITQSLMKQEYETKLLVERTEYKALQAQINPHFLYNTLETMRGIAISQNCPLVAELCRSLSAIFRYSLNISDSMSSVQKELEHVKNYIYVMDVRGGGSIEFTYDIDDETLYDMLPRITVQPIVENAIEHGLRNVRRKDKALNISTVHRGEELIISISDNGVGMDARAINRELEANDPKRVESGVSIGILNVNARLKNLFGPEYGLRVESIEGEGTTVHITVPALRNEEEYSYGKTI